MGFGPTATPPAAPSNLKAKALAATRVKLIWVDNSANETGFRIERKTGTAGVWARIANVRANRTAYIDTGLVSGTAYVYRVRASNANGYSAFSKPARVKTP